MPSLPVAVLHDPAALAGALSEHGVCLLSDFPVPKLGAALHDALKQRQAAGTLRAAQVGHGKQQHLRIGIRGDDTQWLDDDPEPAATSFLAGLQALRVSLNQRLYLGLDEEEAHFAFYPVGACYHRHRDQFQDSDARVLSLVSYLNHDWRQDQGGALRLHLPQGSIDVLPHAGTSIIFSSDIEHEVLPATRERLSIAAWFRRRSGSL
ncbi:MAG: 2OG-Fe(II) oxygenase [Pseudoxanthomonas sp.]